MTGAGTERISKTAENRQQIRKKKATGMKMIMSLKKKIQGRISKMTPGAYNVCFPIMYMRNPEKKAMELWSGIIPEKELEFCSQRFYSLSSICFFFGTDTGSRKKEQQKK